MFIHERKELENIRSAVEEILAKIIVFKEHSFEKPDNLLLEDDAVLNTDYEGIHSIFQSKLEGKITKDLARVVDYEQILLDDLLKEGFAITKEGLFFKKYNLEKYLIEQIEKVDAIMHPEDQQFTVKEFKELSKTLSTGLKVLLKMIDQLLLESEELNEETDKSLQDIKKLRRTE